MSFNPAQPAHRQLRSIIAEKTNKLIVWTGSGVSAAANLPTWPQLKKSLLTQAREKIDHLNYAEHKALNSAADRAQRESNPWIAFQILRKSLGRSSYRSAIRQALKPAMTSACPQAYHYIWKIGAVGVLNLNLDRLATKALGEESPGNLPIEFPGCDAGKFLHALKSPRPFIANLHGIADDESSWVLTNRELKNLLNHEGYNLFIRSCLAATTTLFVGISADDVAAGGHLQALTRLGIDTGDHYWLTNKDDIQTDSWAERAGIQIIRYSQHKDVLEFFQDILEFIPEDESYHPPVVLTRKHKNQSAINQDILRLNAEELRKILNTEAQQILDQNTPASYEEYEHFSLKNDEAIYRAWYTSVDPPSNKLLDFTLTEMVAQGAFGRVYRASSSEEKEVAIKVLLEEVRRNPEMLKSFRRGVRSMQYLAERDVEGMVAYREASEIPAFVVMDWVDGPTLSQAKHARQIEDWDSILKIGREMTDIIRRAHSIPERVLHRDLRPSNIMLKGFYSDTENWNVVVLDFDLSWHQGAYEQSVVQGVLFGYLAPEQLQSISGASTRHAAVDSFGVGMTLYFMISGMDPIPAQHRHPDWNEIVQRAAMGRHTSWKSLPFRYSRLILRATEDAQSSRWDMSQICDELERLRDAFLDPKNVVSAELLAEELAARIDRNYEWDDDQVAAIIHLTSGLEIRIIGDESGRKVSINLNWSSRGRQERKQIDKWMIPAKQHCVKVLRDAGWRIGVDNVQRANSVVIMATLSVERVVQELDFQATIISQVTKKLDFE